MTDDEFLENLGLEVSLPDTPAEDNADSVEDKEKDTPKEDVETKAEDEVVQQVAPEKDSQQEELERLRKENENLNKRLKDTQRSLTQKSEELKNARKREVEDSVVEDDADDDDDWFTEPSDDEEETEVNEKSQGDESLKELQTKLNAQEEELRLLKEYQEQQRHSQALSDWQKAEAPIKEKYPDYAEIVDGPFLNAVNNGDETSAWLMAEFRKEGSTPEAAYKVAKKYCDYIGYKAKSATTETTEKSSLHKTRISDDPDFNSAPPSKDNRSETTKDWDPLDEFYADAKKV
jgi:DNA repair exonuclease SbcCD ATPase subunit